MQNTLCLATELEYDVAGRWERRIERDDLGAIVEQAEYYWTGLSLVAELRYAGDPSSLTPEWRFRRDFPVERTFA